MPQNSDWYAIFQQKNPNFSIYFKFENIEGIDTVSCCVTDLIFES